MQEMESFRERVSFTENKRYRPGKGKTNFHTLNDSDSNHSDSSLQWQNYIGMLTEWSINKITDDWTSGHNCLPEATTNANRH